MRVQGDQSYKKMQVFALQSLKAWLKKQKQRISGPLSIESFCRVDIGVILNKADDRKPSYFVNEFTYGSNSAILVTEDEPFKLLQIFATDLEEGLKKTILYHREVWSYH